MSGVGQKAPDQGASGVLGSALRDCRRAGLSALKYTLIKHVLGCARVERRIEI
jgi:hypothetical protein